MKAIWRTNPDAALFPIWDIFTKYGITREYFPLMRFNGQTGKYEPNKLEISMGYANDIRSHNVQYAIWADPSHTSEINPAHFVGDVIAAQEETSATTVMLDIEYHAPDFILECLRLYRRVRKSGPLSWTLEPFQAGWFTKELIKFINNDINMVVVVQNFFNDMTPAGKRNGKTPRQELISAGLKATHTKIFYDATKIFPGWQANQTWDGCILSEETIHV